MQIFFPASLPTIAKTARSWQIISLPNTSSNPLMYKFQGMDPDKSGE
jgi:hypothetical protein